jgi:mono/diheme cytochrome c family protein
MNPSSRSPLPSKSPLHLRATLGARLSLLLVTFAFLGCQTAHERSSVERGRAAFGRICSGCHGFDGKGGTRAGFTVPPRDLTDPAFHASITDEQILFTLRNGKGQMPAFAALLPESEQLELLAYVRSLGSKAR